MIALLNMGRKPFLFLLFVDGSRNKVYGGGRSQCGEEDPWQDILPSLLGLSGRSNLHIRLTTFFSFLEPMACMVACESDLGIHACGVFLRNN